MGSEAIIFTILFLLFVGALSVGGYYLYKMANEKKWYVSTSFSPNSPDNIKTMGNISPETAQSDCLSTSNCGGFTMDSSGGITLIEFPNSMATLPGTTNTYVYSTYKNIVDSFGYTTTFVPVPA